MTTTAAQDEFNELMRDKDRDTRHPEDRHTHDSDVSEPESPSAADDRLEIVDTDDELDIPSNMRSSQNYYMPSLRSEANTGPKGVIADAQAFEQAKKQAKRFTWKKSSPQPQYSVKVWHDEKAVSDEEEEDSFMKEWRAARLKELQNMGQRIRSRTNSPTRKVYGNFPLVDGQEYLKALESSGLETTVVVFVFSSTDNNMERAKFTAECAERMREVAQRNDTTRFIKLDNADAEMEEEDLPAVYAYKRSETIGSLGSLRKQLAKDDHLTAVSLETIFRQHHMI